MAEMPDPLQPLRDARVPDEIVRPLAEVMVVDELVRLRPGGQSDKVQALGASIGGQRRLELEWEPPQRYANERPERRQSEGRVRL